MEYLFLQSLKIVIKQLEIFVMKRLLLYMEIHFQKMLKKDWIVNLMVLFLEDLIQFI